MRKVQCIFCDEITRRLAWELSCYGLEQVPLLQRDRLGEGWAVTEIMSTVVTGHKGYSDREGAMRSQWDGRRKCNWIAVVKVKHPINIGFASRSEFIVDRSDGPTRARLDHLSQEPVVRVFLTAVTRFAASGISTSLRSLPHLVSSWLVGPESGVPILA